ncbi:hypothetical protein CLV92_11636 [Kineococcus xinjiangensis]|uniref:Lipoprotein n=1 Tax=Kineococcus xinjiangensis TaxID=512762 RepID=A0A2S6ID77_9ACTN|nr:hypothetical protein [Kineococcus xinjiangensis]PPK92174.1 hypothetical protein CLV92_11636 [Kineococcus xinjiangensis]
MLRPSPALLGSTLLGAVLLTGCTAAPTGPAAAVGEEEARERVAHVVDLAAQRTPEAMVALCERNDDCIGMSGGAHHSPDLAPGPDRAPQVLCTVGVPATPSQAGSRLVVLDGVDGHGRPYVTHVLVERDEDGLEVQEPAFWLGIRYTGLQPGRAWSGGSGLAEEDLERHNDAARRACTDTTDWVVEVSGGRVSAADVSPASRGSDAARS